MKSVAYFSFPRTCLRNTHSHHILHGSMTGCSYDRPTKKLKTFTGDPQVNAIDWRCITSRKCGSSKPTPTLLTSSRRGYGSAMKEQHHGNTKKTRASKPLRVGFFLFPYCCSFMRLVVSQGRGVAVGFKERHPRFMS